MPVDKPVVWAPAAERDLLEIWGYYAEAASPDLADDQLRNIMKVAERLSEQYSIWRRRDEIAPGLRSVRVPPHVMFYRIKNDVVEIARVLHERRNLSGLFPQNRTEPPRAMCIKT